jgi:hypothetical protein
MVKVPLPLHPDRPVRVQLPEIVFPFTLPWRVRTLFVALGNNVLMVMPKVPMTLPLEFPLRLKVPVSEVGYDAKQGPSDVKVKFVTVTVLPLAWENVVMKP